MTSSADVITFLNVRCGNARTGTTPHPLFSNLYTSVVTVNLPEDYALSIDEMLEWTAVQLLPLSCVMMYLVKDC